MSALSRRLKTSLDDMFTLLLAVGADCVGDVSVVPAGTAPVVPEALAHEDPSTLDFDALFRRSIGESPEDLDRIALAGVQEKVPAEMVSFPLGALPAILKLNPPQLPRLVENEAFFLKMAAALGVPTNEARLVHDRNGRPGLWVRRFDRFRDPMAGGWERPTRRTPASS